MDEKPLNLIVGTFLIIIASTTDMANYFKYPMILIALASLGITFYHYYKSWKTKHQLTKQNK